jgi:hypothetical protein
MVALLLMGNPYVTPEAASPSEGPGGTSIGAIGTRGNHTSMPTLMARADPAVAYTSEMVTIHFDSTIFGQNETGARILVPSNHLVNVTVFDVTHDVLVKSGAVPLFVGRGTFTFPVEPLWTSARLNISVIDYQASLFAFVDVRTHMSEEYQAWYNRDTVLKAVVGPIADMRQEVNDAKAFFALAIGSVSALFIVLMAVLFLQIEHKRSRTVHHDSIADRLRRKLFRWSLVDTFLDEYFDPERTWDIEAARRWTMHRKEAQIAELRQEQDGIESEIRALEEAMLEPTTITEAKDDKGVTA